jgi:digeranylgeranylglycerophospholipid reductase
MRDYDVIVIGGGPIGAVAARRAAMTGARTLLLEKGDGSGKPARCTGLVSPRTLDVLEVSNRSTLREIRGGRLHAPGGRTLNLHADHVKAVVVDRAALNRELLERAHSSGAEIRTHATVTAARRGQIVFTDNGKEEVLTCAVIVGADGARSSVASWCNLPSPSRFLTARQVTVEGELYAEDGVEIFLDKKISPGLFAWAVPAENGFLRVGLATSRTADPDSLLARFLAECFPGSIVEQTGGFIPIGYAPTTVTDGVLLVGDAAGQVKPTSGGGLYTSGLCARSAGEIAGYAALADDPSHETLREYERRWHQAIGKELRIGLTIRRTLDALSNEEIDAVFSGLDDSTFLHFIADKGDIDYPSRLVAALLPRRDLWPRLLSLVPALGGWTRFEKLARVAFAPSNRSSL